VHDSGIDLSIWCSENKDMPEKLLYQYDYAAPWPQNGDVDQRLWSALDIEIWEIRTGRWTPTERQKQHLAEELSDDCED